MKINIIIDNQNSWFFKKAKRLVTQIKKLGHRCVIYDTQAKIPKNSDISFFLSCEDYITKTTRAKSKFNIVVHASDLPNGKGMSPTTWQIIEGKNKIPVTLFEVAEGFDSGNWYLKNSFTLDGHELVDEWQEKLFLCIERMVLNFVKRSQKIKAHKQVGKSSVYKRRGPKDSELDINQSIKKQFNLLRVVDNEKYPAWFKYKGKKYVLKIYKQK
ncbi:MAG: methionyl-tRNA formyltransferase [Candidatus Buchananbacteria bacterium CG10_big_fil_rev_8_21_14_0_10_42_9]|uniref:Methionyl-tRNA formyltransferase n=1 Tax=Candidatus Buchananbacteria bacterium CG10_big_fil_rev_8_21_14_0_10_42_9 TaxID=1974526 RepID=A0A2H0W1S6_9BACT|nr:MAG: methionyl-tRNA formyltransferase [Candidatus Buchananbacteria bacterium CG10_big_fil_rev_8_21_14_0_10_42_9]